MNRKASTLVLAGMLAMGSGMAWSDELPPRLCAFVYDSSGHLVRDSQGDCVHTRNWTPERDIVQCNPALAKKEEPKQEPVQAEPAPPPPPPKPRKIFKKITLSAGAYFDVDSADLKPEALPKLDALVEHLKGMARIDEIRIEGHTDSTGSAAYNKRLSLRRANAVKNYLVEHGIDPSLISTIGWGEEKPVASNATKEGRAKNRRVEIYVSGEEAVIVQ